MRIPEVQPADAIVVTSSAFDDGGTIPRDVTCRGAGKPPAVSWRGVPDGTASLALVVSDPDAPKGPFVHWIVSGLPPVDGDLAEGRLPAGASESDNSAGKRGWYPPCPPSGRHRYRFTIYALDGDPAGRSTQDLLDDIGRKARASGTLTGLVAAG